MIKLALSAALVAATAASPNRPSRDRGNQFSNRPTQQQQRPQSQQQSQRPQQTQRPQSQRPPVEETTSRPIYNPQQWILRQAHDTEHLPKVDFMKIPMKNGDKFVKGGAFQMMERAALYQQYWEYEHKGFSTNATKWKALQNYGCHCDRLFTYDGGKGDPIDAIDNICADWNHCKACDWDCSDEHFFITFKNLGRGLIYDLRCSDLNQGCQANICMCHMRFVRKMSDILLISDMDPTNYDAAAQEKCVPNPENLLRSQQMCTSVWNNQQRRDVVSVKYLQRMMWT